MNLRNLWMAYAYNSNQELSSNEKIKEKVGA